MKCKIDNGDACRRCQRSGIPCIFIPRANAARPLDPVAVLNTEQSEINRTTIRRLKAIEEYLGLAERGENQIAPHNSNTLNGPGDFAGGGDSPEDRSLRPLWEATASLQRIHPNSFVDSSIWQRSTVKHLWLTCVFPHLTTLR